MAAGQRDRRENLAHVLVLLVPRRSVLPVATGDLASGAWGIQWQLGAVHHARPGDELSGHAPRSGRAPVVVVVDAGPGACRRLAGSVAAGSHRAVQAGRPRG